MRYRALAACAALLITGAAHASIVLSTDTSTLLTGAFSDTDGSSSTYEFATPSQFVLLPNSISVIGVLVLTNTLAELATQEKGLPDNPFETLFTSGAPANLSGMFSNNSSNTNVYFLFYDQSLDLSAPLFSGDFCFSTDSTTCATLASASGVPEPASIALVGAALAGLGYSRRNRQM